VVIAALALLVLDSASVRHRPQDDDAMFVLQGDRYVVAHSAMADGSFAAVKPAHGLRVFVLGGSTAMGTPYVQQRYGLGDELMGWLEVPNEGGIPTWLQEILDEVLRDRTVEVVNAARGGEGSAEALQTLQRVIEAGEPDLVVLLAGNNERDRAEYTYLADPGVEPRPIDEILVEQTGAWEANLDAMVEATQAAGVPLVVSTMPTNLRDWLPADDVLFDLGTMDQRIADGETDACLDELDALDAADNALVLYYRARCVEAAGDEQAAAALYSRARDRDRNFLRVRTPWNDAVRDLDGREGVLVVDLEQRFAGFATGVVPGRPEYFDFCHMRLPGYQFSAGVIAEAVVGWRHPDLDPAVVWDAELSTFGPRQLRRLYWLKRLKWFRHEYADAVPLVRQRNTEGAMEAYEEEMWQIEDRIRYLESTGD